MRNHFLRLYEHDAKESDFLGNGIAVLNDASDVVERIEINGERTLEFVLCSKRNKLTEEQIVSLYGQRYRIKTIDGNRITATAIYQDAAYKHIQYLPDMIGKPPRIIMLSIFDGTPVNVLDENTVQSMGMEWVTDLTDFFECSKITPIGALNTLMETIEKYKIHAELYVDNYNIALVKQIGSNKGKKIDVKYNAKSVPVKRDTTEMITRLYPYGKDDMDISTVNNGLSYIDSPNYSKWQREGYMDFSEIEDPDELLKAALAQFDEKNPERIDIPKYSVTTEYAQRKPNEICIGDLVTVVDRDFCGIQSLQRVIAVENHPFEPSKNSVTVGTPPQTASQVFDGVVNTTMQYQSSINAKGEVKSSYLENIKSNYKTQFNKSLQEYSVKEGRKTVIHDYGDIWVNPNNPNQALAIAGGVIAMANGRDENGDWDWSAFGDWSGFTADAITTGKINTGIVDVISSDGNLKISDNLILMRDKDGNIRLKTGLDTDGQYVFKLMNKNGVNVLELNSSGKLICENAEIKGGFFTVTDDNDGYVIQDEMIVGYKAGVTVRHGFSTLIDEYGGHLEMHVDGKRGLHIHTFEEDGSTKVAFAVEDTGNELNSWRAFECVGGSENASTKAWGNWDFSNANVTGLVKKGVSGTFTTADNHFIRVVDGIITFIG